MEFYTDYKVTVPMCDGMQALHLVRLSTSICGLGLPDYYTTGKRGIMAGTNRGKAKQVMLSHVNSNKKLLYMA